MAARRTWQPWGGLIIGLLFTAIWAGYLFSNISRTRYIERLVKERTEQLSQTNESLESEIRIRTEAEDKLRKAYDGLEDLVKGRTIELSTANEKLRLDIAERKRAEEALRQSEEKYRMLVNHIPDVAWTTDADGYTLFVSPQVKEVYGYTPEEIYSDAGIWTGRIHPEDIERVMTAFQSLFTENKRFDIEYRVQRKDGDWIWLHDRSLNVREKDGQRYADGLFADITDRKRREAEKAAMEEKLRQSQKLESIGQLAAGIAHEINTPTQYVSDNTRFLQGGFTDVLSLIGKYHDLLKITKGGAVSPEVISEIEKAEGDTDLQYLSEEIPKAIQQSLEGIDRVAKIVRAMKEFSHPGTKEKIAVDINRAIDTTITVSRNEWKYVAEMVTAFDPSLPLVPCLPGELNQVILNVITNAAHAISDIVGDGSSGKGIITVNTRHDGNWAEIRISDTGTGVPKEIRAKIFDPFFTTKEVGKGTGQGLAITRSVVVNKHGGTIDFETEVGKGSTFIIRLPLNGEIARND
jgi:PAS domain S-box-containing protein